MRHRPKWLEKELSRPTVACVCGGCAQFYRCPGCERTIPCCVGGCDALGELCDDCACDVWYLRGESDAARGVVAEP